MLLAVKVTSAFDRLTRPERVNVLIQDDSVIKRNRSKKVELLARVYDHVEHKFQKGFTLLTLGWSDGYSFIPTGFNLLSSASENNRYNEISNSIDHRTNGYKFRKASMMRKTDAAVQLIRNALTAGIKTDYVLMDTWFTTEPMLKEILDTGIDAIGMVKQLKQRYTYNGRQYTLPGLFFMYCEDIQDMDLTNALQSLMALFVEHISTLSADITSVLKSKVIEWIASQATFIQALFGNICRES